MMRYSELANKLRPYFDIWAQEFTTSLSVSEFAPNPHALDSSYHTGTLADSQGPDFVHISSARTITAIHSFSPLTATAPFTLGANAQGQLVTGLNADKLDGNDATYFVATSTQVVAGAGLTGGGALTGNVTLNVVSGDDAILVGADTVTLQLAANPGLEIVGTGLQLGTPGTLTSTTTNSKSGASHTHAVTFFDATVPTIIQPDATAATGSATTAARRDHTHGIVAAVAGAIQPDDAAAEGVATSFSRSDHKHSIVAAAPTTALTYALAASEGSATSFARSDHVHAITSSFDVGATPAAALLRSTDAGGLTLATLTVRGSVDILNSGNLTVGANIFFVNAANSSVGINCAPDSQFDLDVAGSARVQGWIVGKHAIQLENAYHIFHYDGLDSTYDYTGTYLSHMGLGVDESDGVGWTRTAWVRGVAKFGKSVIVGSTYTNYVLNPVGGAAGSPSTTNWTPSSATDNGTSMLDPIFGQYCFYFVADATNGQMNTTTATISGSTAYTVSAWVKSTSSSVGLRIYTAGLGTITTVYHSGSGDWEFLQATITTGVSDTSIVVRIIDTRSSGFDKVWFDGVQCEEATYARPIVFGDLPGCTWNGTAHSSSSYRTANYFSYPVDMPAKFSISLWLNMPYNGDDNASTWGRAFTWRFDGNNSLRLIHNPTTSVMYVSTFVGGVTTSTITLAIMSAGWHHYVVTFDGTQLRAYVDGVEDNGSPITPSAYWTEANWPTTLYIGSELTGNQIDAYIDDFVVTKDVLDADLIRAIYESDAPLFAETSTFSFKTPGVAPIWADEKGFYMRDSDGDPVFAWAAQDSVSWGGKTLNQGDGLIGIYGASQGGWQFWDRDVAQLSLGYGSSTVWLFDSGGATLDGVLDISTSGGIYQGTGTFASPTTGLKLWNDTGVGRIGGYNGGTIQWYANTDGKLYAGAGSVWLDAGGLSLDAADLSVSKIKWDSGGTPVVTLVGYDSGTASYAQLYAVGPDIAAITLYAYASNYSAVFLQATANASSRAVSIEASSGYADLTVSGSIDAGFDVGASSFTGSTAVLDTSLVVGTDATSPSAGQAIVTNKLLIHPATSRTTTTYGIQFGTEINLYRSATSALSLNASFLVSGDVRTSAGVSVGSTTNDPTGGQLWVTDWIRVGGGISDDATDPVSGIRITAGDVYVANGNDIYSYALTSHSPSYTGWVATPTRTCHYKKVGKTVYYYFYLTGTSNSTAATITLPYTPARRIDGTFIYDGANGYGVSGYYSSGTTTLNLYGDWQATGTKTAQGTIVYEASA